MVAVSTLPKKHLFPIRLIPNETYRFIIFNVITGAALWSILYGGVSKCNFRTKMCQVLLELNTVKTGFLRQCPSPDIV